MTILWALRLDSAAETGAARREEDLVTRLMEVPHEALRDAGLVL